MKSGLDWPEAPEAKKSIDATPVARLKNAFSKFATPVRINCQKLLLRYVLTVHKKFQDFSREWLNIFYFLLKILCFVVRKRSSRLPNIGRSGVLATDTAFCRDKTNDFN